MNKLWICCVFTLGLFCCNQLHAQQIVKGHLYVTLGHTLSPQGIMVDAAASGRTVFTDKNGYFEIAVAPVDTLYFFIGNKRSQPYYTEGMIDKNNFSVSLESIMRPIQTNDAGSPQGDLEDVTVYGRNYRKDSLQARQEYGKYFDYKNPKLGLNLLGSPVTAIYDVLNTKKKRRMNIMKSDLLFNEQEGYVDSRFTRTIVVKYIGNQEDAVVKDFMLKYRPKYEDIKTMNELDLAMYITSKFNDYKVKYLDKSN